MKALVVTRAFAQHKPGDRITDPAQIEAICASSNHACVVPVPNLDPPPPPFAPPAA